MTSRFILEYILPGVYRMERNMALNSRSTTKADLQKTLLQRLRWHILVNQLSSGTKGIIWRKLHLRLLYASIPTTLFGIFIFGSYLQSLFLQLDGQSIATSNLSFLTKTQLHWAMQLTSGEPGFVFRFIAGLIYFLPVFLCSFFTCLFWERIFIRYFKHESDGSHLLTSTLFCLLIPLTLPISYSVIGLSFGLVFGKLLLGGAGRYFVNPVLLGVIFLNYSYPGLFGLKDIPFQLEGSSSIVELSMQLSWQFLADGGVDMIHNIGRNWLSLSLFSQSGVNGIGSTSPIATLLGMLLIYYFYPKYWRVPLAAIFAAAFSSLIIEYAFNSSVASIPWYWHLITGQFLFCLAFIAFDPAVMPISKFGHFIYGGLFGSLTILFRVFDQHHSEGTLSALLLTSLLVPLIDWVIVAVAVKRKKFTRRLNAARITG